MPLPPELIVTVEKVSVDPQDDQFLAVTSRSNGAEVCRNLFHFRPDDRDPLVILQVAQVRIFADDVVGLFGPHGAARTARLASASSAASSWSNTLAKCAAKRSSATYGACHSAADIRWRGSCSSTQVRRAIRSA
jgi:hypothetical protein